MMKFDTRTILVGGLLAGFSASAAASLDHAPADDAAVAARDGTVTIDVLANDPGVTAATILRVQRHPANGSVVVSDRKLVYTPSAGFTGRDTLTYIVKTVRSVGLATVTVDVVDGVTLSGKVTAMAPTGAGARLRAAAGAGAGVVARVGTQAFHAQAGKDGSYQIEVAGFADDMVRLESTSGSVALASIVGSFGRLADEAGADGVLTRDENSQVQVTPLSAALAYLLQLANEGEPVADEAQLEAAQGAIDTAALLEMAAAVKLVADGDYALPAGVPDTLALISDTDAYRQFVDDVYADDAEAFNEAIAATLADPDVVPPAAETDLVGVRTLLVSSAPGTIRTGLVEGTRLALAADGTGSYADVDVAPVSTLTWALVDGVAHAVLDTPRVTEYQVYRDGQPVRLVNTLYSVELGRLLDGGASGRDLVAWSMHSVNSYPDNPEYPDDELTGSAARLSYLDGSSGIPFQAGEFPAVRALQVFRPENDPVGTSGGLLGSSYALHQFNAGGSGELLDDGQGFSWSLDGDGRLQVAYDDGETAVFTRLLQDGRKGDGVIAEFSLPDGNAKFQYALSSVRDGSLVFDAGTLVQPWRSGFDISQTAYDFAHFDGFYIVLDEGGTGTQVSISEFGTTVSPLAWGIEDGAMVARRYWSNAGWQPGCEVGVDGCYVAQERRWVPVSRDGNRIYLHEELWMDPDGAGPVVELELQSQRANFYDIEAPPLP